MVRMAAIAVIDVASGRIEALAGALSPCTRQEYDGPGRAARCDRLPYPIRYRPDALLNAAVFHDAMPASTIKPIMAAAFLSDPAVGPRWLAAEQADMDRRRRPAVAGQPARPADALELGALSRSHVLRRPETSRHARGPGTIQAMALAFGWNDGCAEPREDCGKRDLLFGRAPRPASDAWTRRWHSTSRTVDC